MPKLSCWSCGRQIYTVSPLSALFAEERRCPRCGAFLHEDRRETERRLTHRRINPPNDPGPPRPKGKGTGTSGKGKSTIASKEAHERRVADRRAVRRRGASSTHGGAASDMAGWQD
jgi:hypothetical protein